MVSCTGASGGPSSLPSQHVRYTDAFPPRPASTNGAHDVRHVHKGLSRLAIDHRTTSGEINSGRGSGRVQTGPNLRW
jgi:hypothetical protein